MVIGSIREGFELANRNIPVVFFRLAVSVINIIAFFIFVGLPVFAAVAYFGFDIGHVRDMFPPMLEDPVQMFSHYRTVLACLGLSFIGYSFFVFATWIYSLGGTLGVLRASAADKNYRAGLSSFLKEANRNFPPLFRLFLAESAIIVLFCMIVIVVEGGIIISMQGIAWLETFPEILFGSFLLMVSVVFVLVVLFIYIMFMMCSAVVMAFDGGGVSEALGRTVGFLKKAPEAFLFTSLLFISVIAVNVLAFNLKVTFALLLGGFVLSVMIAVLQNYLAVIVWSSLTAYYMAWTRDPASFSDFEI